MRWLHFVAAFTWVGGLIFVNLVLTPVVQPKGIPPPFVRLMGMERFRWFAWGSIIIIIITGFYNILVVKPIFEGLVSESYRAILITKLLAFLVMIIVTAATSMYLKAKITKAPPGPGGTPPEELKKLGPLLVIFSRLNLGLGLLVILLAVLLGSGLY